MLVATAAQTIGPFFRAALERPEWSDLTRDGAHGAPVLLEGTVVDGDGVAVPDALLELWQADEQGRYVQPDDVPAGRLFRGFGRACTDPDGRYWFRTVVPGGVAQPDGSLQAPHANLTIFARGLLKRLVTRIYFADRAQENEADPVLRSVAPARRATLLAQRTEQNGALPVYRFDVVLQGERETVFLEI